MFFLPFLKKHLLAEINITLIQNKEQAAKKCAAVTSYKSRSYRPYIAEDKLRAWLTMRGLQVEEDYAEVFQVIRWIER